MGPSGPCRPPHSPAGPRRLAPFCLGVTVRHEPDVSVADWFINADAPWNHLACQGPPGFEAYADVWLDDGEREHSPDDHEIYRLVVEIAANHTSAPSEATFGLWEGDGSISGGWGMLYSSRLPRWWTRRRLPGRIARYTNTGPWTKMPDAFDETIMAGPRADLRGFRAYLLFVGAMTDYGQWPVQPTPDGYLPQPYVPAIAWPADHTWFIAADTDDCALTIGGTRELIDEVLAHPDLDARPTVYGQLLHDGCDR